MEDRTPREDLEHEIAVLRADVVRLRAEIDRLRDQLRQANAARYERPPHYQ
ncbi:MAG: hypothetical protein ACP5OV_03180 [Acidimicrobiales bacterium]